MRTSKVGSLFLSLVLALSLVPAQGLAEALDETQELGAEQASGQASNTGNNLVQDERLQKNEGLGRGNEQVPAVSLLYRANAANAEDPWTQAVAADPAPEVATDAKPLMKIELKLAEGADGSAANGSAKLRVRKATEEWPEEWTDDSADANNPVTVVESEPFEELQLMLEGELAATHDVWYRVHAGDRGWLGWAHGGASAGTKGCAATIDGVQVLLLANDSVPEGYDADKPAFVEQAVQTVQPENPAGNEADPSEKEPASPESEPKDTTDGTAEQDLSQAPVKEQRGATTNESAQDSKKSADETATATEATKGTEAAKNNMAKDIVNAKAAEDQFGVMTQADKNKKTPTVTYDAHVENIGWQPVVTNGSVAGTSGRGLRVEAMHISLPTGTDGGITYRTHVQNIGWQDWVKDGAMTGTSGRALRLEGVEIKLTGNVANDYDVWYRGHVQNIGWQSWVKNGAMAGTSGQSLRVEALQITLVPKGGQKPSNDATVTGKDPDVKSSISYRTHVNGIGWQGWMSDGETAGTSGMAARMTGFVAQVAGVSNSELHYSAHVENVGWDKEVTGGTTVGYPSKGLRVEALKMRLSGTAEKNFDIYYRVHVSDIGWLNWAKNGAPAGTQGMSKQVEAVQVVLVTKAGAAPSRSDGKEQAFIELPNFQMRGHVQNIGWQNWVGNGGIAGTSGQALRVEALQAKVSSNLSGEVQARAHVQNIGWQDWVGNDGIAGTHARALRVEAIQLKFTDELAEVFDIYYRVHAANLGWLDWASNGSQAGTSALSLRLEAVQVQIVPKGSAAPGPTTTPYLDGTKITKLGYQNPAGFYQVSSKSVQLSVSAPAPFNYITPSRIGVWASRQECVNAFLQRAREYVGTPYVWNYACAPGVGVDCIGLVYQCAYACGMDLGGGTGNNDFNPWAHYVTGYSGWHSHDAENFWNYGRAAHVPLGSILPGDLISWSGHIAIYMGGDTLIEAYTPSTGVIYSSLSSRPSPRGAIRLFQ